MNPDRVPGLGDSKWVPPKTLSTLPGLRAHPEPAPTWDNSSGYTVSKPLGLSINDLPRYAWNGGVKPTPVTPKTVVQDAPVRQ